MILVLEERKKFEVEDECTTVRKVQKLLADKERQEEKRSRIL